MEYKKINFQADIESIMTDMDYNFDIFKYKQKEILRLESLNKQINNHDKKENLQQVEKIKDTWDEAFETKVKPYIQKWLFFKTTEITQLEKYLPPKEDYDYERIIKRLMAESLINIKNYNEMLGQILSKKEYIDIKKEIVAENKKQKYLRNILLLNEEQRPKKEHMIENELIFVPTASGNIRVLEEIASIDIENYQKFYGLFQSIKNGTFKNFKSISGANFPFMYEVRDNCARVVYQALDKKKYAIITAFIKKSINDKVYREKLENKVINYLKIKSQLKNNLQNPSFLEENKKYEKELFYILHNTKGQSTNDNRRNNR